MNVKHIPTFHKELVEEFTTRNMIKIFRTKDIPESKNKPNVNNSDVTEKKKNESTSVKEDFKKKKIDILKDLETAKELVTSFIPKCNESNKNLPIKKIPEISAILNKKKWRNCNECISSNCQLMQHLCKIHRRSHQYCQGKKFTNEPKCRIY